MPWLIATRLGRRSRKSDSARFPSRSNKWMTPLCSASSMRPEPSGVGTSAIGAPVPSVISLRPIVGAAFVSATARGQDAVSANATSRMPTRMGRIMRRREVERWFIRGISFGNNSYWADHFTGTALTTHIGVRSVSRFGGMSAATCSFSRDIAKKLPHTPQEQRKEPLLHGILPL